jgi:hypothetical protein
MRAKAIYRAESHKSPTPRPCAPIPAGESGSTRTADRAGGKKGAGRHPIGGAVLRLGVSLTSVAGESGVRPGSASAGATRM